jgi:hypothetical protein
VRAHHVQPTLRPARPEHPVRLHGYLHPLEGLRAQVVIGKITLHQAPGRIADDHCIWRRQPLQPSRDIRCVSQGQRFLPRACPHGAHHHQSRMHAQAHGQPEALVRGQPRLEWSQGIEYVQPRSHGALRIVLMRVRIAEVHQETIAEVLGNVAIKALNHVGAGGLIGAYHLAVIFRVKLPGEGGRVHQITEQHRELTPFGLRRGRNAG